MIRISTLIHAGNTYRGKFVLSVCSREGPHVVIIVMKLKKLRYVLPPHVSLQSFCVR